MNDEVVQELAYALWQSLGKRHDSSLYCWMLAKMMSLEILMSFSFYTNNRQSLIAAVVKAHTNTDPQMLDLPADIRLFIQTGKLAYELGEKNPGNSGQENWEKATSQLLASDF